MTENNQEVKLCHGGRTGAPKMPAARGDTAQLLTDGEDDGQDLGDRYSPPPAVSGWVVPTSSAEEGGRASSDGAAGSDRLDAHVASGGPASPAAGGALAAASSSAGSAAAAAAPAPDAMTTELKWAAAFASLGGILSVEPPGLSGIAIW